MSHSNRVLPGMLAASLILGHAVSATAFVLEPVYKGPVTYQSSEDSPFPVGSFGFCVEDFEDGTFDVPGASGNGAVIWPGGLTDSVDADDGAIDGSGTGGYSYFYAPGSEGVTITFPANRANGYPTRVGIVWTDGGFMATVSFQAFGANGDAFGLHGPFVHADGSNSGGTGEDRFYGVSSASGISKIVISNAGGGIEVDHLQLDHCVVCGDANSDMHVTASDALSTLRASVGSAVCRMCVCDANNSTTVTVSDALAILRKSVGLNQPLNCPYCMFNA